MSSALAWLTANTTGPAGMCCATCVRTRMPPRRIRKRAHSWITVFDARPLGSTRRISTHGIVSTLTLSTTAMAAKTAVASDFKASRAAADPGSVGLGGGLLRDGLPQHGGALAGQL